MTDPKLTSRFEQALLLAAHLHAHQERKGSGVPYIAHLLSVTALVLENGGDEDQAIAALLHDAAEDQGGLETLEQIRQQFGERVAAIVHSCSDTFVIPKPPWRQRKETYLKHLLQADEDALLVSLADKVHNSRSILGDLQQDGEQVWQRFKGGKSGTLWYYQELLSIFRARSQSALVDELERSVTQIVALAPH